MMRLLEKQEIDRQKATERKKEVDEGMKLAKTVDNLRKVKGDEEANLRKFRDESLKVIKSEIDSEIVKRDKLRIEVATILEARLNAQAPLDLKEEWKKVKGLRSELELEAKKLTDLDVQLIAKESQVLADKKTLLEKEESLKEKEALTQRYASEISKNYELSEKVKLDAENLHKESQKAIHERYLELANKEKEFSFKERDFNNEKVSFESDKAELEKEKLHIASQQTSLRIAWLNIKKLQDKKK